MSTATLSLYVQNCQEAYKVQACCEKHVYGGFIKVINKEGLRAKEGLVCLSSKLSLLKPNSMTRIFTCVLFAKLVSKVIMNIRYYITEKDLSSCLHMNRRGS